MKKTQIKKANNLPEIDLDVLIRPTATLAMMIQLFRSTTGLDLFLVLDEENKETEITFSNTFHTPEFCQLVNQQEQGNHDCKLSHKIMTKKAIKIGSATCMLCHNGFITVHYPIKIKHSDCANIQTTCCISYQKDTMLDSNLKDISNRYDIPTEQLSQSIQDFPKVSKMMIEKIQHWLELIVTYMHERSAEHEENKNSRIYSTVEIIHTSSIEYKIRSRIAQQRPLPLWRSNKSTGLSKELITVITDFVVRNYHLDFSANVMANALGFEPSYFSKEFKKFNGEGFNAFLKRIRLNEAKMLLKSNPYLSIKQISDECGYTNPSYFTRVFVESFGIRPSQYKNKMSSNTSH